MKRLNPWHLATSRPGSTGAFRYPNISELQRRMNHLMEQHLAGRPHARQQFQEHEPDSFKPRVDMKETIDEIVVVAELPGLHDDQIEVYLINGILILNGEKIEENKLDFKGLYQAERRFGKFQRAIPLPCEVDDSRVEAFFNRGIMTIILPKLKQNLPEDQKIVIKLLNN